MNAVVIALALIVVIHFAALVHLLHCQAKERRSLSQEDAEIDAMVRRAMIEEVMDEGLMYGI